MGGGVRRGIRSKKFICGWCMRRQSVASTGRAAELEIYPGLDEFRTTKLPGDWSLR